MLLCCCGVSEVADLLRSGSLICCVCLPLGITAANMPLLSFVRPSVFDTTIVLPWSYSGSLVPSCWGSCSVPLVLTCVCVSCVLCCLCCPLCVSWYGVHISRVLCGGARKCFLSAPAQHTAYIYSLPADTKGTVEAAEHTRHTDTRDNQRYRTASPTAGHQRTRVRPRKDDRNVKYGRLDERQQRHLCRGDPWR